MISIKRKDEIWNAIYAEPCLLDFNTLNTEELSFAIGIIISAGSRNSFKKNHFNKEQLRQGFNECMRVLDKYGILIFKWNEEQIKIKDILKVIDYKPLLGNKRAKTHWLVFMKK
ncbi:hypothetical protein [Clostridium botulinum]|uniref:Uncharacterized protein n=1 Tax=Clostridium sporogenes TaxID=1509 RepID=A0AAE6I9Q2_CLOSG|nr:hypothetical protein CGS26_20305 [Clostridium sporogenes]